MTNPYHAILLDTQFTDKSFIQKWKGLSSKKSRNNPWWQIKIEVPEERLEELVKDGQKLLKNNKFYFHAYRDNELIVVFPEKVFYITPDRSTWDEMLKYCRQCGIPEDQDVEPARFEDEKY